MSETTGGIDKLTGRILEEAQREADATMLEAEEACRTILENAQAKMKRNATENQNKAYASMAEIRSRSRTNAELEARKAALFAKRQIIDEAFEQAAQKLCALPPDARAEICRALLLSEAEGGETVSAAKNDRPALAALVPEVSAALARQGKAPLTLSEADAPAEFGFFLYGKGYDKDCSFQALLEDLRGREESSVARILFE